jgi:hypothetical protein
MNGKARFPNEITNLIDILRWHIFVVFRAFSGSVCSISSDSARKKNCGHQSNKDV